MEKGGGPMPRSVLPGAGTMTALVWQSLASRALPFRFSVLMGSFSSKTLALVCVEGGGPLGDPGPRHRGGVVRHLCDLAPRMLFWVVPRWNSNVLSVQY